MFRPSSRVTVVAFTFLATLSTASLALANPLQIYWIESGNGGLIRKANFDGSNLSTIASNVGYARALDVDAPSGKIYWTADGGSISGMNIDGTGSHLITTTTGNTPSSVSLDPIHQTLYWTDYNSSFIGRVNLDGTGKTTFSTGNHSSPLSLVVDTRDQKLFWSDVSQFNTHAIYSSNLDGSNQTTIVSSSLPYPTTLQLDLRDNLIFWADTSGVIKRAGLDGSGVQTLISGLNVPSGLALDLNSNKLFYSTYYAAGLYSANLDGSGVQHLFDGTPNGYLDEIAVVSTGVPEPASLAVLGITPAFLLMRRPKRTSPRA